MDKTVAPVGPDDLTQNKSCFNTIKLTCDTEIEIRFFKEDCQTPFCAFMMGVIYETYQQ